MTLTLQDALLAVLSVSIAVNGWFIKDAFSELRHLRADQVRAGLRIARHDERIAALERRRRFPTDDDRPLARDSD